VELGLGQEHQNQQSLKQCQLGQTNRKSHTRFRLVGLPIQWPWMTLNYGNVPGTHGEKNKKAVLSQIRNSIIYPLGLAPTSAIWSNGNTSN